MLPNSPLYTTTKFDSFKTNIKNLTLTHENFNFFPDVTRLGQIPEGAARVSLTQYGAGTAGKMNEMLLTGRHLTATEMASAGLVSQTFFPGRLMEETVPRMKRACADLNSGLQWNKLLLKQGLKSQVGVSFNFAELGTCG